MNETGKFDSWALYELDAVAPPWRNFILRGDGSDPRKNSFRFGYNGERFSRSRDICLMEKYRPEMLATVREMIEKWF